MYCLCCLCPCYSRCLYLWHFRVCARKPPPSTHLFRMTKTHTHNNGVNHSGNNKNDNDDDSTKNEQGEQREMNEQKPKKKIENPQKNETISQNFLIIQTQMKIKKKKKIEEKSQKEICEIQMHSTLNALYFIFIFFFCCVAFVFVRFHWNYCTFSFRSTWAGILSILYTFYVESFAIKTACKILFISLSLPIRMSPWTHKNRDEVTKWRRRKIK